MEIVVLPYSVPISLRGRYYHRSGSVKQELTGASLNEVLLKHTGKTWDDVIEPRASFDDIDERTIKIFLQKAEETGRLLDINGLMGAPTQIRVYDDKLTVWNHGTLPEGMTLDKLTKPYSSYPRNPILAETCFRGGYID